MYFRGIGVRNFISSSSEAINVLAARQEELNLKAIVSVSAINPKCKKEIGTFMKKKVNKKSYREAIYENGSFSTTYLYLKMRSLLSVA
jgi:hypothetical protein